MPSCLAGFVNYKVELRGDLGAYLAIDDIFKEEEETRRGLKQCIFVRQHLFVEALKKNVPYVIWDMSGVTEDERCEDEDGYGGYD